MITKNIYIKDGRINVDIFTSAGINMGGRCGFR